MEFIRIIDLKEGEKYTDIYALIEKVDKKHASNGSQYLDVTLQDRTGSINSKKWDATDEDVTLFTEGNIVKVSGHVGSYRNDLQFTVKSIVLNNSMDIAHFLPSAPVPKQTLEEKVKNYILDIANSNYRRVVNHIVKKYEDEFFIFPAASKNHHEYVSGLAHHVVSMLDLAESISMLYPNIDRDLLYAGVILHDLGKVQELSGNVGTHYTLKGKLLGHITIAAMEIELAANELSIEGDEIILLQHLILAHHGKLEFGSPKLPQLREAEVLNFLDNFDSRMNMLDKELADIETGEFSKRIFSMEGRSFYKTK